MNLFKNMYIRISKDRQARLKFGAEVFNVFNQVSFNAVGTTYGSAAFGTLTSALDPREADFKMELTF